MNSNWPKRKWKQKYEIEQVKWRTTILIGLALFWIICRTELRLQWCLVLTSTVLGWLDVRSANSRLKVVHDIHSTYICLDFFKLAWMYVRDRFQLYRCSSIEGFRISGWQFMYNATDTFALQLVRLSWRTFLPSAWRSKIAKIGIMRKFFCRQFCFMLPVLNVFLIFALNFVEDKW